ncbi:MAG: hypothetical protein JNK77_01370 [Saprospiraceae bacterium]|nr:hypothetical protein [Saprospiraceae bacterium]
MVGLHEINKLIVKALNGTLSLDELYTSWPEVLAGNELIESIYNNVESAVEHLPGIFSGEIDFIAFKETIEYKLLKCDLLIVKKLNTNPELITKLNDVRKKLVSSQINIYEIEVEIQRLEKK